MNRRDHELEIEATMDAALAADAEHPWLGLGSFTEASRAYFFGREEEVTELSRRVQRKLLTILFGKSGLGKTSILQAGVVPLLRDAGYCPIYVRISYAPDAPSAAEQIKQAIIRTAESQGEWSRTGVAVSGESLWEFLHHRDDVLLDHQRRPLIPLIIFDQFEELFTLGQTDDAGRTRAQQFLEQLADLVENRPPRALEVLLEEDESAVDGFDFARSDYRVLISLREDYLAPLESLKRSMPSITQNRMRLAPMNGARAFSAVARPGGKLVDAEVAAAIVRFVAGGAELSNAEVEPSLLSLICRELNDARIASGQAEISLAMLDGSHAGILGEFYERSVSDQPEAVRRFIEDKLLTESGYRESVAEENVLAAFAAGGAPPDALATLINRRLLRIEERLDVRRVELTHDVLCRFVKESRDRRQAREREEQVERQLVEQRQRALESRRTLARTRRFAAVCGVLAIAAVVAAAYGFIATKRANQAEQSAERARFAAQGFISYITDDLTVELQGIGRLDVIASLAKKEMDYYQSLPASLKTDLSQRDFALAEIRFGLAERGLNQLPEAQRVLEDAAGILSTRLQAGQSDDQTQVGLALALAGQAVVFSSMHKDSRELGRRGYEQLAPLMAKRPLPTAVARAVGFVTISYGFPLMRTRKSEESIPVFDAGRAALRDAMAVDPSDASYPAWYAEISAWESEALGRIDRRELEKQVREDGLMVVNRLLQSHPQHIGGLRAEALLSGSLGQEALAAFHPLEALPAFKVESRDWRTITLLDPNNTVAWGNRLVPIEEQRYALTLLGRDDEIEPFMKSEQITDISPKIVDAALVQSGLAYYWGMRAYYELEHSLPAAETLREAIDHANRAIAKSDAKPGTVSCTLQNLRIGPPYLTGHWSKSSELAQAELKAFDDHLVIPDTGQPVEGCRANILHLLGQSELLQGHFQSASNALTSAVAIMEAQAIPVSAQRVDAIYRGELALAQLAMNQAEKAKATLAPALALEKKFYESNPAEDQEQHSELAFLLLIDAKIDPVHKANATTQAQRLIASLPRALVERRSWQLQLAMLKDQIHAGSPDPAP